MPLIFSAIAEAASESSLVANAPLMVSPRFFVSFSAFFASSPNFDNPVAASRLPSAISSRYELLVLISFDSLFEKAVVSFIEVLSLEIFASVFL